jgi:hypothetical protein
MTASRPEARVRRRKAPVWAASILVALLSASVLATAVVMNAGDRLSLAAADFLRALPQAERAQATYPFDDDERFDLRLIPFFLDGLRIDRLDDVQDEKLRALLGSALSPEGLAKVETIMSLEHEVRALERRSLLRWPLHFFRDPQRYHITIFGEPKRDESWGFRFDGHHVSLNFTVVPGNVPASTPLFIGTQPREIPSGYERAGLVTLKAEEDLARALYLSLEGELRDRATLPFASGRDLFLGEGRKVTLAGPPDGVARAAMPAVSRQRLDELLDTYLALLAPDIAAARRAEIDSAGRDQIHFAWAGSVEAGEPNYYRLRGPTFLIEFDNSLPAADHVHAIWRDFDGDFGEDLLRRHYAEHDHRGHAEHHVHAGHAH